VVLWHGMGDSYNNPDSMQRLIKIINRVSPNTFVHSVYLDQQTNKDRDAGFFGNLNEQIPFVCHQLNSIAELKNGFNAIGLSQGGLFLRSALQKCPKLKVFNLITLGSPHSGVSFAPGCDKNLDTIKCRWINYLMRNGAYSYYIRNHIIQAQYVKDPTQYETYLKYNSFLPDVNNELKVKNQTYFNQLINLNKLILFKFEKDTILIPKDTAWFSTYESNNPNLIKLEDQISYKENWLGLKTLKEKNKLFFFTAPFEHMQFTEDYFIHSVLPHILNITITSTKSSNIKLNLHQKPFKL
ncbi:palmitoyl-protein thioesterase, partial [Neoconidiobolus thromboides FSU 785]